MNEIQLKPLHFASVSGGKDSLYMFLHILSNPRKYPLDGVIHFELEIDYPWVVSVIDHMERKCKELNIPFYRIRPRKSWQELYERYGFPNRRVRWCNTSYKLDCKKQWAEVLKEKGYKPVYYIGLCYDEQKRFKNDGSIYPLAELGIYESTILEWARKQDIFNNYYKHCKRQGCMFCPMATYKELAYLCYYYPDKFEFMFDCCRESEKRYGSHIFQSNPRYDVEYVYNIVKTKWVDILKGELYNG